MSRSFRSVFQRLAAIEIWPVALSIAAAIGEERLLPGALVVAALFWPVRWLADRRLSVRTAADWPIGVLALLIPVTLWATALPEVTRPQVLRLLAGIALYYAIVNWAGTPARLRTAVNGLLAAGLGLAAAAPLIGGTPAFIPGLTAAVNANVLAGALAVLAPLPLGLLLFAWPRLRRVERLLAVAAGFAMLTMAVLAGSRGAWLGIIAALVALAALRWRWGWLSLPLAALAGGLAVWQIGFQRLASQVLSSGVLSGLDVRLEVWSRALYMIQDFPFTGIGMGAFQQVANLLYPFFLAGPDAEIPHAHNLFLQVAVDLGLPGLIAWLATLCAVIVVAWQVYRRGAGKRGAGKPHPYEVGVAAGLLATQAALLAHGLIDAVTWGARPAAVVWAIWGLAMAAGRSVDTPDGELHVGR